MATELVIRQVTDGVWTFSRPFLRFGLVPFGGRSTAIKLNHGVWVLASTKLDAETKQTIDSLGEVKYIVTADGEHHFHLGKILSTTVTCVLNPNKAEFKEAYPRAKVIGVPPTVNKPGVPKLDGVYGTDPPGTKYGYEDEIEACYFPGFKNKDVAFLHKASKSLIVADLLLNLPAKEQYSKATKPLLMGIYDFVNPYNALFRKVIGAANTGKEDTRRDAKTVMSWDFNRIIPCHGDVIENDGKAAWGAAYADFLN